MNALATDQAARLANAIVTTPKLRGLRAGLYVGEMPEVESDAVMQRDDGSFTLITSRDVLRANPPDILLTNYKMLDFLLMRAVDTPLWAQQRPDTLRYLVVDELHTFDGAQGTDLACLIVARESVFPGLSHASRGASLLNANRAKERALIHSLISEACAASADAVKQVHMRSIITSQSDG